jgi:hypothetical protein
VPEVMQQKVIENNELEKLKAGTKKEHLLSSVGGTNRI